MTESPSVSLVLGCIPLAAIMLCVIVVFGHFVLVLFCL
jgi:hypothetical protein